MDCSLRKCPHGIDPIGSTDRSHNRVQKITFPAYDITLDATTAPDDDFRSHVNGYVKFALTTTDVYGDEWTTALNTFIYRTNCTDITNKDCSTAPWFDQDLLDAYDTDPTSLYPESLLADQVRAGRVCPHRFATATRFRLRFRLRLRCRLRFRF